MDFDAYYSQGPKNTKEAKPMFVGNYPAVAKQGEEGKFGNDSRYLGTPRGEMTKRGATTVRSADLAK